jgi:sterol desaturase/sphingolipid hydroxylase (fatty acid hydroxylase superfamily)
MLDFVEDVVGRVTWLDLVLFALSWLGVAVGAAIAYFQNAAAPRSLSGFRRYCFPPILFQRTTFMDICCTLLIFPLLNWPLRGAKLAAACFAARAHHAALTQSFGAVARHDPGMIAAALLTLGAVLCTDFGIFTGHFLSHKSRVLWEFHKMHHSSTSLIPQTTYRAHPVDDILEVVFSRVYMGIVFGTFWYLFHLDPAQMTVFGIDWFFALNLLNFFHLRHSHIYLRLPAWWEFVFYSPRNHQVHHSVEERHWDRNFGHTLALWDRLFGSYVTETPAARSFEVGLSHVEPGQYESLWKLYLLPFVRIWRFVKAEGWLALFGTRRFAWQRPVVAPGLRDDTQRSAA